jgi:hypothetical protein
MNTQDILNSIIKEIDSFGCRSIISDTNRGTATTQAKIVSYFPKHRMDLGEYNMKSFINHIKRVVASGPNIFLQHISSPKRVYHMMAGRKHFKEYSHDYFIIDIIIL